MTAAEIIERIDAAERERERFAQRARQARREGDRFARARFGASEAGRVYVTRRLVRELAR